MSCIRHILLIVSTHIHTNFIVEYKEHEALLHRVRIMCHVYSLLWTLQPSCLNWCVGHFIIHCLNTHKLIWWNNSERTDFVMRSLIENTKSSAPVFNCADWLSCCKSCNKFFYCSIQGQWFALHCAALCCTVTNKYTDINSESNWYSNI